MVLASTYIFDISSKTCKARFTSALRQPCTCLRTHFWGISCGSLKTILRFARPQGCRNVVRRIFNMFIFLAFFGRCLEVARQLQGSLEMTARLTYEFATSDTWAAANQSLRLSHEGRRVNARTTCGCLAFDARLSQECYEAYDNYKPSHSSCTVALRQTRDFHFLLKTYNTRNIF